MYRSGAEHCVVSSRTVVGTLRVATKRLAMRGDDGNRTIETNWMLVGALVQLAERYAQSLLKGSRVRVIGRHACVEGPARFTTRGMLLCVE
jgi:single-stranded DNA-binding protein